MRNMRQNCHLRIRAGLACLAVLGSLVLQGAGADSETNTVLIAEDFESYGDSSAMRKFWTTGTGEMLAPAPGGGQAAQHDGGDVNRHGNLLIMPDEAHDVVLTADLYDFATNTDKRVTVALRNTNGASLEFGLHTANSYVVRVSGFSS